MKHNAVSKETPLIISISSANDRLTFSNNINPKLSKEESTGLGLENIKNRYALLTKDTVEVKIENDNFIVIIPLINMKHENSDSRR